MPPTTAFDDWVRQRRKALDMTQAELAAQVGCAVVTIKKIEQATRHPSRQMANCWPRRWLSQRRNRRRFCVWRATSTSNPVMPPATDVLARAGGDELLGRVTEDADGRLIGREGEMGGVQAHLTGALKGSGRIVLISGEAGYGKTTLMTHFARHT